MLLQDVLSHRFGGAQNRAVHHCAAKRRSQGDDGSDIVRALAGHGTRDDSSKAVANQVDLLSGVEERFFDVLVESPLDQQVGALGVQADAREIRPIADPAQP